MASWVENQEILIRLNVFGLSLSKTMDKHARPAPVELFDDLKSYLWHFRARRVTNVKHIFGLIRTAGDHDYLTISTTKCQK